MQRWRRSPQRISRPATTCSPWNLAPAQQFVWTAAPRLRNLPQRSGGYFSARFTSATGAGSGGARCFLGINDSLDGYFDVTLGTLISGNNVDIPLSLYLQIYSLEAAATPPTFFDLRVNPLSSTTGAPLHGVVTLTGPRLRAVRWSISRATTSRCPIR